MSYFIDNGTNTWSFPQVAGRQLFGNFSYFEPFFSFRATFCFLSNFSSYLLILRYRSSFQSLNWPFFHISQCYSSKKKKPNPPPAGLLGQRFLEKIQNGERRFTSDWLECLGWRRSITNFISSLHFFCFNWGESFFLTLVTPQNSTKMLRNLTLLYSLHI